MARLTSTRLDNVTIKPRRIPTPQHEVKQPMLIAEYVLTSCEECETELAMTVPFDGEPVRCAAHDQPSSDRFSVGEDVIAIDDDPDEDRDNSQYEYLDESGDWLPYEGSIDCE